ncbi:19033_t:CDS:2 [Racocetra fulgida]|uniref:19033_t:CDS:1 n=1 Tax=Racocetra fulgida TaxID=60492 RepID=A0A9N8VLU4_9GLOM|nr:19033_t:CDS:2 [Racocetra fulgida]
MMSPDSKNLTELPEECIRQILTFVKDNKIKKYLNELNEEEQKILIPLMVNLPPTQPRPKCASHLVRLDLHDLYVACIKLLAAQKRFCECGELRIVSLMVSSIIKMLMRTNNLQSLSLLISGDEPDLPESYIFSSSQPGLSNLRSFHLVLKDTLIKVNIREFIDKLPELCSNLREIAFDFSDNDTDDATTSSLTSIISAQEHLSTFILSCRTASAQRYISELSSRRELKNLHLNEIDFSRISINSLNAILKCERLEQITISESHGISYNPHYQYSYPRDFSRLYRRAAENSEIVFTRSNIYEIYNIRDPSLRAKLRWENGPPLLEAKDYWRPRYEIADLLRDLEDCDFVNDEATAHFLLVKLVERLVRIQERLCQRWPEKLKRCCQSWETWDPVGGRLAKRALNSNVKWIERIRCSKELAKYVLAPIGGMMPIEWTMDWEEIPDVDLPYDPLILPKIEVFITQ